MEIKKKKHLVLCIILGFLKLNLGYSSNYKEENKENDDPLLVRHIFEKVDFSEKITEHLQQKGLDCFEVSILRGCQRSLFLKKKKENNSSYPREIFQRKDFPTFSGSTAEKIALSVEPDIAKFRNTQKQILNLKGIKEPGKILSPLKDLMSRSTVLQIGLENFSHVFPWAYEPEEPEMTSEEKETLRQKQLIFMKEMNEKNQISDQSLNSTLKQERKNLEPFMMYFDEEKEKVRQKKRKRITRGEVIQTYETLVSGVISEKKNKSPSKKRSYEQAFKKENISSKRPNKKQKIEKKQKVSFCDQVSVRFYDPSKKNSQFDFDEVTVLQEASLCRITLEGYTLDFNPFSINLDQVDEDQDTNRERMILGKCPVGPETDEKYMGDEMNYHHVDHYDLLTHKPKTVEGIQSLIRLLPNSLHKEQDARLHFKEKSLYYFPMHPINRSAFGKWRGEANKTLLRILENGQKILLTLIQRESGEEKRFNP